MKSLLYLPLASGIQLVKLNTTLESVADGYLAYPQQRVYFTCITTGSNIQEWYSVDYITGIDDHIQLHEGRRTGSGRAANAMIINITTDEAGERIIVSQLSLIASTQFPVSTVSCGNNGQGMRNNITFNITGRLCTYMYMYICTCVCFRFCVCPQFSEEHVKIYP